MALINLYSDTQTRPSSAMRKAMAEAEVGDEQRFEDPTVTALCERVAELLGFEAAVFLPSGTMCNEIAFRLHIRPGGDEAILHRMSHPIIAEAGGNVLEVNHHRMMVGTPAKSTTLGLVVEARDSEHAADIRRALTAGGYRQVGA